MNGSQRASGDLAGTSLRDGGHTATAPASDDRSTVLIVDDDPLNRFLLTEALATDGYRIEEAASGEAALQSFTDCKPDLVLLDIDMPGMDGLTACRALRQLPGGTLTSIVMITGLDDRTIIDDAFDSGATDFLPKPLNWRLVRQRVRFLLRHAAVARNLRENERILDQVQAMVQVGHWRWDIAAGTVKLSDHARAIFPHLPPTSTTPCDDAAVTGPIMARIRQDLIAAIKQGASTVVAEHDFTIPGRGVRRIATRARIHYRGDTATLVLGASQDITELVEKQTRLLQADLCIRNISDGIALISPDFRLVTVNPAFEQITGRDLATLQQMQDSGELSKSTLRASLSAAITEALRSEGYWRGEVDYGHSSGRSIPVTLSVSRVKMADEEFGGYVVVITDNSDIRDSERRLYHLAHHDPLTGLPNRLSLQERLRNELTGPAAGHRLTLLYIDLDGFKLVNDSMGHTTGDALLTDVAQRLRQACDPNDLLARIGGDEFALVLFGERSRDQVFEQGQRLLDVLRLPFQVQGRAIFIGASIGACRYPDDADNAVDMLRNADTAMYEAKRLGRGQLSFWSRALTVQSTRRMAVESELRAAITADELFLEYQPKFAAQGGAIVGAEALVRWRSPARGVISPDQFIPVAEESGLVVPLGEWVINEACRQIAEWRSQYGFELQVAVNISALHMRQPSLLTIIREALARYRVDGRLLEIEITEESLGFRDDTAAPVDIMNELNNLGLAIAIDDFGTGYSSLSQLKQLPISTLKIDRSFVTDLTASASSRAIITAIVQMGKTLGMQVVAEGVETEEQAEELRAVGCDLLQGFLFARPLAAAVLAQRLAAARA